MDLTLGRVPGAVAPGVPGRAVPAGGGATLLILDDFNRADGPIGPNWTVHNGYFNVVNNAAQGGSLARATFNGAPGDGNVAEADIAVNTTNLQYTGLLLNYGAGNTNLFLKVQDQNGDLMFHHAACYTGNNGAAFGLGFFALSSPFATAHMKATRVGNDVTIEFTNIDGGAQPPQTYVCSGAPAPEGTGIGILGYAGFARIDNFGIPGGAEPTIHVADIGGAFSLDPYGRTVLRMRVSVRDEAGSAMVGAMVDATIWWPVGSTARSRPTGPNGNARFHWGSNHTGEWGLCVDNVTLQGYLYDPEQNVVTCMTWYN